MQAAINGFGCKSDSDMDEVDVKIPLRKINKKKKLIIKRSNPHSNLDEEYINRKEKLMHPQWDTLDPTPNILSLFKHFDTTLFQGRLKSVMLEWGKHMNCCAGISFSLKQQSRNDVTIRLSELLLKPRARKYLVDTMLHQMIHAYLFIIKVREPNGGHGPYFKKISKAINKAGGTDISTRNTLPVSSIGLNLHWWRCNGICQERGPFFGYVQTQALCAPDSELQWYAKHHEMCGGTFMRIKSPEIIENPKKRSSASDVNVRRVGSENTCSVNKLNNNWVEVDEEVLVQDFKEPVITLSSSEEDDDCAAEQISSKERIAQIKNEIIRDSIDLCANDFEIIGDVEDNTNYSTAAPQSSDLCIIQDFFKNTLSKDFKIDNDCQASSSRYLSNPESDIIKCFICEDKLARRDYAQHLNGCGGISKKIVLHPKGLKKLSAVSREARPRRQMRPSGQTTRDILRNAGYSEDQLLRIATVAEEEDDDILSISEVETETTENHGNAASVSNGPPEIINISSEDENTIRYRQRNLYITTRECPVCLEDVEESHMNNHLDICMMLKKPRRSINTL